MKRKQKQLTPKDLATEIVESTIWIALLKLRDKTDASTWPLLPEQEVTRELEQEVNREIQKILAKRFRK